MESILETIKKMLGYDRDYTFFDTDILAYINGVLTTLNQLGVGPEEGFFITGYNETWNDFLKNSKKLNAVITYIFIETKILFDPPSSSFVLEALKEQSKELEWRLEVQAEGGRLE